MFAAGPAAAMATSCATSCCFNAVRFAGGAVASASARLAYCMMFALSLLASWILRDQARPLIEKMPCASPSAPGGALASRAPPRRA